MLYSLLSLLCSQAVHVVWGCKDCSEGYLVGATKSNMSSRRSGEHSIGGYMAQKSAKQKIQLQEAVGNELQSNIFRDVTIWVDGYTTPTQDELKQLVAENGGFHLYHYSASRVTHIIAEQMTDSKLQGMFRDKCIVRPAWIVDSIREGTKLSIASYRLSHYDDPMQPRILPHFTGENQRTAKQPGFLQEFYANSRLHHISTAKSILKSYVQEQKSLQQNLKIPKSVTDSAERVIMHVDMDCFFASVALRNKPELEGKPVVICHSEGTNGGAEIACASYGARKFGIKNGMWMQKAKDLCSDIVVLPYDFEEYTKVSKVLYDVLLKETSNIQAVSVDEALLEVTGLLEPEQLIIHANHIRQTIYEMTGCTASIGIGSSILLARLATKKAKPNGCFQAPTDPDRLRAWMMQWSPAEFPGIGYRYKKRLLADGICSVADILPRSLASLQGAYGKHVGKILHDFSRGIDDRPLELDAPRKTVGLDVNWGVRFSSRENMLEFMQGLSQELQQRLVSAGVQARHFTLKVRVRAAGQPVEPIKYLGCGICDDLVASMEVGKAVDDLAVIERVVVSLIKQVNPPFEEVRGIGLHATKLVEPSKSHHDNEAVWNKFLHKQGEQKTAALEREAMIEEGRKNGPKLLAFMESEFVVNLKPWLPAESPPSVSAMSHNEVPTLSQIDTDVFDALPAVVRSEILSEIERDKKDVVSGKRRKYCPEIPSVNVRKSGPAHRTSNTRDLTAGVDTISVETFRELPPDIQKELLDSYPTLRQMICKGSTGGHPILHRLDGKGAGNFVPPTPWNYSPDCFPLAFSPTICRNMDDFMRADEGPSPQMEEILIHYLSALMDTLQLEDATLCIRWLRRMGESQQSWKSCIQRVEAAIQRHGRQIYGCNLQFN